MSGVVQNEPIAASGSGPPKKGVAERGPAETALRHSFPDTTHRSFVVEEVRRETDESATVILRPETSAPLRWRAGQFLTLAVLVDGVPIERCYSICRDYAPLRLPAVTIKGVEGGVVSNLLLDTLRPGMSLRVRPPAGRFVLPSSDALSASSGSDRAYPTDVACFAGGSGITPIRAILERVLLCQDGRASLFYANRAEHSVIFSTALHELQDSSGGRFVQRRHFDEAQGIANAQTIDAWLDEFGEARVYFVCGPAGMMDLVLDRLKARGVPDGRVKTERFTRGAVEELRPPLTLDAHPRTISVTLRGKRHHLPYRAGHSVLETCRESGVATPSSCEGGFCGSCMAVLKFGDFKMNAQDALGPQDIEAGRILTCQARPSSSLPFGVTFDEADFRRRTSAGDIGDAPPISPARLVGVLIALGSLAGLIHFLRALL